MSWLKLEPVRLYSIVAAAVALVGHYVPDIPSALVLALAAAVIGTGQVVREHVIPMGRFPDHAVTLTPKDSYEG